ncbi:MULTISPECIES: hypothetical protein [Hydrogenophaga]|uniref:Uncharacterized protein n=1 Tax=Hydrogenophaga intermedia TaxID=65786 RepID=A0A1L1PLW9_HYDIT|nr:MULTISPECIES: hypothetical protein [Hydrogenophaga]TMU75211.1 hypothetical protein FGJ01_11715 [Hydrogenophaga intermedia]CDN90380.1 hypothetical protein BN948_04824 [Hydrogenophaga intermedia]
MFITAPGLVQHLHPSQVAPRQGHWPAITLALVRPWYLLVYDVSYNGQKLSQTSLVAWDTTLLDLLARIPVADLSGIARLHRRRDAGPSWALEWIGALWAPAPCESPALGPVLFQLGQDPQLRTTDLLPVGQAPGRRLLYQASSSQPGVVG